MAEFFGMVIVALLLSMPAAAVFAGLLFIVGSACEFVAGIIATIEEHRRR